MDSPPIYQRLPNPQRSIRLLSIAPGWPLEPISVGLVTIEDIKEAPVYDALSYVWGTALDPDPILCNGVPKQVTTNLSSALRAFRPLPSQDPEAAHQHGLDVIGAGDVLHSSRHLWREFATNKWERPLEDHADVFFLWIDALCINQEDLEERANQIRTMREIYEKAQKVRVWFGTGLDYATEDNYWPLLTRSPVDTLLGRVRLSEYGDMPVVLSFLAQAFENAKGNEYSWDGSAPGFPPAHLPEWQIFRKFFRHPWFYRVWTVQEIAMAKSAVVIVGDWEIQWSAFAAAVEYLWDTDYRFSISYKSTMYWGLYTVDRSFAALPLESARYMCQTKMTAVERPLLLGLLALGRNRGATQVVDYIFAVLNLSADWASVQSGTTQHPWIEPNYTNPVAVTFTQATMWLIRFHSSLDALFSAEYNEAKEIPDLPSWVPVWSSPYRATPLAHGRYDFTPDFSSIDHPYRRFLRDTGYNADLGEPMQNTPFGDARFTSILEVHGLILSSMTETSEPLLPKDTGTYSYRDDATAEEIQFVESAWELVEALMEELHWNHITDSRSDSESSLIELGALYQNLEELILAFILTLCSNRSEKYDRADEDKALQQDGIVWLSKILGPRFKPPTSFSREIKQLLNGHDGYTFQSAVSLICSWRRFFVTGSGHMGIGPVGMRRDDVVAVLFGSTTPFVVRRVDGMAKRYKLVGECYVHGIMDGELVERWKRYGIAPANVFELE